MSPLSPAVHHHPRALSELVLCGFCKHLIRSPCFGCVALLSLLFPTDHYYLRACRDGGGDYIKYQTGVITQRAVYHKKQKELTIKERLRVNADGITSAQINTEIKVRVATPLLFLVYCSTPASYKNTLQEHSPR